jgi:hypothetical protein
MKRKDPFDHKTKINLKYLKESLDLKKLIKLISSKNLRIKWNKKDKYYFTESKKSWKGLGYKILQACADHSSESEYLHYRIYTSYKGNKGWNVSFETQLEKGLLLPKLSKNFKLDYVKNFKLSGRYKKKILIKCKEIDHYEDNLKEGDDFYCKHVLISSLIDKSYYLLVFTNLYLEFSDGSNMKKGWNLMNFFSTSDTHQKFSNRDKAIEYINKKEKELFHILEVG